MPTQNTTTAGRGVQTQREAARMIAAATIAGALCSNPHFTAQADDTEKHSTRFEAAAAIAVQIVTTIEKRLTS